MKTLLSFVQFAPIWVILKLFKIIPIEPRSRILGRLTGGVIKILPSIRKRADDNLALIFPDMAIGERLNIRNNMASHVGQTLGEILFNEDYAAQTKRFHASGPGIDVLKQCKAEGQGAIIVSGHFGQWEAIRHYLMAHGMETGALYRPTNNPFYEKYFLRGIKRAGEPIVPRGTGGVRTMIKTLRSGGFMAILIDQRQNDGQDLPFLGYNAKTGVAAAEMALKLKVPLVPVFATRAPNGLDINIDFQNPIEPTDAVTMTIDANQRLESKIREYPAQWFWVHKRWLMK
ncbi:hypothetical protein BFP76_01410 [Amylibacter kogurei]|uniref:Lauroyl acyltransferase n=1 Tax=Paramylibacter kogurei TaxID=1889778 RepID=A0A2G5K357_9RHOB|nr:lysophospholipid acyltransferase family protein [Amylibacter kogurei]PIB23941.1 hypothetical protein BFP76_01410 [Amylibacter kogurei]